MKQTPTMYEVCWKCEGTGYETASPDDCPECNGTGLGIERPKGVVHG